MTRLLKAVRAYTCRFCEAGRHELCTWGGCQCCGTGPQ